MDIFAWVHYTCIQFHNMHLLLYYCLAIMCPPLPDIDNGVVDWSGVSPGGVATYTCDPGFILVGEPTQICRDNGTWSDEEPTCECKLLSPLHVYCSSTCTYCCIIYIIV